MSEFYPPITDEVNEVYNPEWIFLNIDEQVPTYLKKEFRKMVKLIMLELSEEGFSESEIEDYLKKLVEHAVTV
jgi:molybdopterin-biosynthesis enzyme MoeA-like protein